MQKENTNNQERKKGYQQHYLSNLHSSAGLHQPYLLQHNVGIQNGKVKAEEGILGVIRVGVRKVGCWKKVKNLILNRALVGSLWEIVLYFQPNKRGCNCKLMCSYAVGSLFYCLIGLRLWYCVFLLHGCFLA